MFECQVTSPLKGGRIPKPETISNNQGSWVVITPRSTKISSTVPTAREFTICACDHYSVNRLGMEVENRSVFSSFRPHMRLLVRVPAAGLHGKCTIIISKPESRKAGISGPTKQVTAKTVGNYISISSISCSSKYLLTQTCHRICLHPKIFGYPNQTSFR